MLFLQLFTYLEKKRNIKHTHLYFLKLGRHDSCEGERRAGGGCTLGLGQWNIKEIENITCIITISNQPDENKPKILDGFMYDIH